MRVSGAVLVLFLLLHFGVFAQTGSINGKVQQMDTKAPMGKVSIFLSNSSYGTVSSDDGKFELAGVKPGQYTLVATSVGFDEFSQTVQVGKQPITILIELLPRVTQLHDVVVTTPADWKRNYAQFEKDFIGDTPEAKECKVANPHDVTLIYHGKKQTLQAWSDEFIVVENRWLGYKVKFLLKDFTDDGLANIISWQGNVLFEDLPGSEAQKKKWKERRDDAYYGSSKQFLRDLYLNKYQQDGFIMYKLVRTPNPQRPDEAIIKKKIKFFKEQMRRDSFEYWVSMERLPRHHDKLIKEPLNLHDVFQRTEKQDVFSLSFKDCLYIVYTKRMETQEFPDFYRPLDMDPYEASMITLFKPYALFDMNGSIMSMDATLFSGTWSKDKLPQLLPVDYTPE